MKMAAAVAGNQSCIEASTLLAKARTASVRDAIGRTILRRILRSKTGRGSIGMASGNFKPIDREARNEDSTRADVLTAARIGHLIRAGSPVPISRHSAFPFWTGEKAWAAFDPGDSGRSAEMTTDLTTAILRDLGRSEEHTSELQ